MAIIAFSQALVCTSYNVAQGVRKTTSMTIYKPNQMCDKPLLNICTSQQSCKWNYIVNYVSCLVVLRVFFSVMFCFLKNKKIFKITNDFLFHWIIIISNHLLISLNFFNKAIKYKYLHNISEFSLSLLCVGSRWSRFKIPPAQQSPSR